MGHYFKSAKGDFRLKYAINYYLVLAMLAAGVIMLSMGTLRPSIATLFTQIGFSIILAVSLNLIVGFLGELSLGHAGFMCVGAYIGGFFAIKLHEVIPSKLAVLILSMLIGGLVAAVFGFVIGLPSLRLKGDYLAIVTLAFGEIIKNLVNILFVGLDENGFHISFTNTMDLNMAEDGQVIIKGAQGITGTPHDSNFTIGIVLLLVTLFIVLNLIHSRDGRAVMAIRDNTIAAESVGIHITKYKLMAFSISAALAGVAGVLYAHNLSTLTALPKNFGYNMSIMILVFVVLGGIGNIRGSVIASVILTLLPELLRGLNDYRMLIYSIVLIVMMLFNWAPKCIEWREKVAAGFKSKKSVKKEAE